MSRQVATEEIRGAGFDDGALAEVVANVALYVFNNDFNRMARTDLDFPGLPELNPAFGRVIQYLETPLPGGWLAEPPSVR